MITRVFRDFQGEINETKPSEDNMEIDQSYEPKTFKFENRSSFIEYIEEECNLMLMFFLNFKNYMLKARQGLRLKQITEPLADLNSFSEKVLAERYIHSDQISERFDFLKYIAQNSSVKVTSHNLSILWRELVEL
jgi:hypothetical protein